MALCPYSACSVHGSAPAPPHHFALWPAAPPPRAAQEPLPWRPPRRLQPRTRAVPRPSATSRPRPCGPPAGPAACCSARPQRLVPPPVRCSTSAHTKWAPRAPPHKPHGRPRPHARLASTRLHPRPCSVPTRPTARPAGSGFPTPAAGKPPCAPLQSPPTAPIGASARPVPTPARPAPALRLRGRLRLFRRAASSHRLGRARACPTSSPAASGSPLPPRAQPGPVSVASTCDRVASCAPPSWLRPACAWRLRPPLPQPCRPPRQAPAACRLRPDSDGRLCRLPTPPRLGRPAPPLAGRLRPPPGRPG
nr:basic proline-rich protein-like [Aegilops tauschii subsp. strangulata]